MAKQFFIISLAIQFLVMTTAWDYDYSHTWKSISRYEPNIPDNAVVGGLSTVTGYKFYVGRALSSNNVVVARVISETGYGYIDVSGTEMSVTSYGVLLGNGTYSWIKSFDGLTERNAVSVGTDSLGRQVFVCRIICSGGLIPGQLTRGLNNCAVSKDYLGCRLKDKYEILVQHN